MKRWRAIWVTPTPTRPACWHERQPRDDIVPTLSQLHGRLLYVTCADHLNVVGHCTLAGGRRADGLPSGGGFTPEAFEATWDASAIAIAIAIAGSAARARRSAG